MVPTRNPEDFLKGLGVVPTDEIEHVGIKGMKWGVRRANPSGGSGGSAFKKKDGKPAIEIGKNAPGSSGNTLPIKSPKMDRKERQFQRSASPETKEIRNIMLQARQHGVSSLNNAQIQKLNTRLQLEKTLSSLTPAQKSKGQKILDGIDKAVRFPGTPAGKAVLGVLEVAAASATGNSKGAKFARAAGKGAKYARAAGGATSKPKGPQRDNSSGAQTRKRSKKTKNVYNILNVQNPNQSKAEADAPPFHDAGFAPVIRDPKLIGM